MGQGALLYVTYYYQWTIFYYDGRTREVTRLDTKDFWIDVTMFTPQPLKNASVETINDVFLI